MSRRIEETAPPIREDGLMHHVYQHPDYWACLDDCPSCIAAGFFLHGPTEHGRSRLRLVTPEETA